MADVDHFKSINDNCGHGFGDDVLRAIAEIFSRGCRAEDIPCRYGGEEFTILLPDTTIENATELAERLRRAIEDREFCYRDTPMKITCSFGVANLRGPVPPSVVELADEALYRAKHSGRNCVEVCQAAECLNA
jgi:diguanylate cyclase (GGDEF)-like protein